MAGSTRKLIKWGSSNTLIISLPRKWIKQNNLTEEQIVKIQVNPDGTLTIIPQDLNFNKANLETEVKVKDPDDLENIRLRILTKYLDGWDIIKIQTTGAEFSSNIRKNIAKIIEPLYGLEILGVNSKTVLIKNVMSLSETISLIKMISDLTIDLGRIALGHINNNGDKDNFGESEFEHIRKYYHRIIREQRRTLLHPASLGKESITLQDTQDFSFYITDLFKIAENMKYIIDTSKKHGVPNDEFGIGKFLEITVGIITDSIDSFLSKETKKAVEIIKKIKKEKPRKREIENSCDAADNQPALLTFQVALDMAEKIMDYSEGICLSALRRAI